MNDPLHHLGPRARSASMSPSSSSSSHRFHSFVVYLMKSAPGRLENAPSECRPGNATIIGIKGASTGHCDRSRARKSADLKCGLAGSSYFLSRRSGRAWSVFYKCEIYLRSGSEGARLWPRALLTLHYTVRYGQRVRHCPRRSRMDVLGFRECVE